MNIDVYSPEKISLAVEEMLHWTCPLHYFRRTALFIRSHMIHGYKDMPLMLTPAA